MKISTRGEYGLLALVDLACHADSSPVQAVQIAERQGIPKQYLDQLMLTLKSARLVTSSRGRQGGYSLAKAAESISLFEVIAALEGTENLNFQADRSRRKDPARSVLRGLWRELYAHSESVLKSKTLAQVCEECASAQNQLTYEI